MLDRKIIVQNTAQVIENCQRRGVSCDINRLVELEKKRLSRLQEAQDLNRQANETSGKIGSIKDAAERQQTIERGRELRKQKDVAQHDVDSLEAEITELQMRIPNLTHPEVPTGGEEDAVEVALGKTPIPKFEFAVEDHLQIAQRLDLVDFEAEHV